MAACRDHGIKIPLWQAGGDRDNREKRSKDRIKSAGTQDCGGFFAILGITGQDHLLHGGLTLAATRGLGREKAWCFGTDHLARLPTETGGGIDRPVGLG